MHEAGVPAGRIYRAKEMLEDPHYAAREMIVRLTHPEFGQFPMQNVVPKLSDTPGQIRHVGPELGAHNEEILHGLVGLSSEELEALHDSGTV